MRELSQAETIPFPFYESGGILGGAGVARAAERAWSQQVLLHLHVAPDPLHS